MTEPTLRLQFNRVADPGVEYAMRTTVEQTTTEPNALDQCLVIKRGDAGTDEEFLRVGDYSEVVATPFNTLPTLVDRFSSASLPLIVGGIQEGDTLTISTPFAWQQFFGADVNHITTVAVGGVVSATEVIVDDPFPAFGRNLSFSVIRGGALVLPVLPPSTPPTVYPEDGVANRYYGLVLDTLFLASDHADSWTNIDVAEGRYNAAQLEAQLLVDATKEDNFSGISDKVYT